MDVFKGAKSAYRERKAEIHAGRRALAEKSSRPSRRAYTIDDGEACSIAFSRNSRHRASSARRKPIAERRHSGDSTISGRSSIYPASGRQYEQDLQGPSRSPPPDYRSRDSPRDHRVDQLSPRRELSRRHTSRESQVEVVSRPVRTVRSLSAPQIDMDLAYGHLHPETLARLDDELELKCLVGKVKRLLDEADCVQHSVTSTIAHLQKNPDAMAAVALTLAEISNLLSKMAPGMLTSLRAASPAVFALLASPQFLIAGGVAVGVTIVAFGGYKIIKKIKAKNAAEKPGVEELLEFRGDVNRIDNWRRGISEAEDPSMGMSVEGEFITPQAAALSRLNLNEPRWEEPMLLEPRRRSLYEARGVEPRWEEAIPIEPRREVRSVVRSDTRSEIHSSRPKTSKSTRGSKSSSGSKPVKAAKDKKEKKPSPLRLIFG